MHTTRARNTLPDSYFKREGSPDSEPPPARAASLDGFATATERAASSFLPENLVTTLRMPRVLFALALATLPVVALAQGRARVDAAPMPAPQGLTAQSTPNGVQLSWQAVANAAQYVIVRAPNATTAPTPIGNVAAGTLTYLDRGFTAAATYQVAAVFAGGKQGLSAPVSVQATSVSRAGAAVEALGAGPLPTRTGPLPVLARVNGFTPGKAAAGTSKKITISGSGFARKPELAVKFTGASGKQDVPANITAKTDALIDVQFPGGATTGKVLVETGTGIELFAALSSTDFAVSAPIQVTRVSPDSVLFGSKAKVTVYGKNFSQWDKIEVRFVVRAAGASGMDLVPVTATNVTDASFDVVVSPTATTGILEITSTNGMVGDFGRATVMTPFQLRVIEPFKITSFAPDRVRRKTDPQPGVTVLPANPFTHILGQGFTKQPVGAVYFTGVSGNQDQLGTLWRGGQGSTDSDVGVDLPAGARTGKVKIVLGSGASAEATTSTSILTVMDPVEVTAVSPASAIRGSKVTIVGKGFLNRSQLSVQFSNAGTVNQSATIIGKTDTGIDVTVPGTAGTGKFSVMVGGGSEVETVVSTMDLTVLPTPLSIESFTPAVGAPGMTVTLTGYGHVNPVVNFANNVRATVVSTVAGAATAKGPTSVTTVTVPAGAITGPITILTAEGSVSSRTVYTIPTFKVAFTDFQPTVGNVGTVITLAGTFDPVAANNLVTFRASGQPSVTAVPTSGTATSLVVTVPAGARTGVLVVASISGPVGLPKVFFLPPSVTGFSTPGGPVGFDIDIIGDNFNIDSPQLMTVKFNGTVATSVRPYSGTVIKVTIPAGATTGPVTVQTPGGLATSPVAFTVR
jgi:hypothetical protein